MLNHWHRSYRLYDHENRYDAPVCQLPAVASRSRRLARSTHRSPSHRRAVAETTRRGPQGLLDLVQAPLLRHRQAAQAAAASRPGATPARRPARTSHSTSASCSRPRCSPPSPRTTSWTPAPAAAGTCVMTDDEPAHRRPAGRHRRRAPGDPASTVVIRVWCPHCGKTRYAPLPSVDRARRPGRAAPDHPHRLPQGRLPRLVLDHPQVRPRCGRLDHLARAVGQDHRQGQPGSGAALPGVASKTCRTKTGSTSMKPGTRRTVSGCGPGASGPGLYTLFKIDPDAQRRRVDRRCWARSSTGCWAVTTSRPIGATCASSTSSLQFCLAHLIRDVKFLMTLPGPQDRAYGDAACREALRTALRGDPPARAVARPRSSRRRLEAARAEVLRAGRRTCRRRTTVGNLAKRFEKHGESYFTVHDDAREWSRRTTWRSKRSASW